jgi:hypothetical protein
MKDQTLPGWIKRNKKCSCGTKEKEVEMKLEKSGFENCYDVRCGKCGKLISAVPIEQFDRHLRMMIHQSMLNKGRLVFDLSGDKKGD